MSAKPRTMSEHQVSRTLLKSPPELWAECSDAQSLARHLDEFFGEVRITRLEPEQAVAWEGERVSGTVRLEPSGWGTKVTMTAIAAGAPPGEAAAAEPGVSVTTPDAPPPTPEIAEAPPEPADPPPEPKAVEVQKPMRMGFFGRLRYLLSTPTAGSQQPSPSPPPETVEPPREPEALPSQPPEPVPSSAPDAPEAEVALNAALDSLGKAHHRPFSRA